MTNYSDLTRQIEDTIKHITAPGYGSQNVVRKLIENLNKAKPMFTNGKIDKYELKEIVSFLRYDLDEYYNNAPPNPDPDLKKFSQVEGLIDMFKGFL